MKKKVLMHHNDLKNLLNSYKIQFSLMNEANITQIYSINYNDDEFSVLEELGINSWNSEIATMKKMKKFYTEEELINIIYQLSSSLELLQKKDMCHFNINPKNIIVYKDKSYKLSDLEYIRTIKDSNIISNDNEFISPQLFNLYNEKKNNKAYINLIKSDVYSLGLCIIYTMTRTNDINNIYRDFILNKSNLDSDNLVCNYFKYPLNTMDNDNFYSHKF
jgi:serine/threonine protein kinase